MSHPSVSREVSLGFCPRDVLYSPTLPNSFEDVRCDEIFSPRIILPTDFKNQARLALFPDPGLASGQWCHQSSHRFRAYRLLKSGIDPSMCLEWCGIDPFTDHEFPRIFHQTPRPQNSLLILKGALRGEKQVYVRYSRGGGVQADRYGIPLSRVVRLIRGGWIVLLPTR